MGGNWPTRWTGRRDIERDMMSRGSDCSRTHQVAVSLLVLMRNMVLRLALRNLDKTNRLVQLTISLTSVFVITVVNASKRKEPFCEEIL